MERERRRAGGVYVWVIWVFGTYCSGVEICTDWFTSFVASVALVVSFKSIYPAFCPASPDREQRTVTIQVGWDEFPD